VPDKEKLRLCLITFGCKANQYDSACLLGYLKDDFILVSPDSETPADIYILNTCTVTHKADFEARQWLRRVKRLNPRSQVIITGCLGEANPGGLREEKPEQIFGIKDRAELVKYLLGREIVPPGEIFFHPQAGRQVRARALLKIQEGCNYRCSYCIVPYARGKSRSLEKEKIFTQLEALQEQGFKEVVLCGINLGEWGKDLGSDLARLLIEIREAGFDFRIRLSSLEPMTISESLLEILKEADFICPHLHLALQSGDDEILSRMKRPYQARDFLALSQELFDIIPNLCLGLDVIAGFPGEEEEHFRNTLELLEEIPFAYLHIFRFSPRPLTPAQKLRPRVPERIIRERERVLFELAELKRRAYLNQQRGRILEMIIEDRVEGWAFGHSENYLYLKVKSSTPLRDKISVKVLEIKDEEIIAQEV